MSARDRMYELTEVEQVEEFMEQFPTGAFFKAGACHKTMQGFGYVEKALDSREEINIGFVRVIESRSVSNYIAEMTGVVHQSPQLILYKDKKMVFDVDNWDITPEVLEQALEEHFGPLNDDQPHQEIHHADATPYVELLRSLLAGEISEEKFHSSWLTTFQSDATPRSTEQFNLLNSLFGDVDLAIQSGPLSLSSGPSLKERAKKLFGVLTSA